MLSRYVFRTTLLASACVLCLASTARADDEGFAINRFEPAERGSDWFTQDSLNILGHGRLALGLTGDWAHQPLVLYDADGDEVSAIVENQLFLHLGGNVTLWDRLRLGVNVPFAVYQSGDSATLGTTTFDPSNDPTI